ncbi:MAG: DUF433 domain-containing protein [Defluviicoccus sp.]|nr:DUF433 domain-containing protein [Defluviicoccus sp.]MDE0278293.1 DUF433 domain-containing protein [Defluviicoccus sp.]
MALSPDLTVRETALLAGVSAKTVEKALEAGVLKAVPAPARFRGGAARFLPIRAVAFFHALDAADLADLPLRHRRALWDQLTTLKPGPLQAIEFAPGAALDLERLAAPALRYAERYRDARDRHIAPAPDGGAPVVAGTGLTVHAVLARLEGGATLEDLAAEYPAVLPRAFAAAQVYATTHPLRGRPKGRGGG